MNPLIKRFEAWLKKNQRDLLSVMNEGAAGEDLAELEEAIGKKLPDLFKALYKWRDGQSDPGDFFGEFSMMPIEEIIASWESSSDKNWIPFLACEDVHIVLDLTSGKGDGPVILNESSPEYIVLSPSFEGWFKCYVESLEAGNWEYSEDSDGWYPKSIDDGSADAEKFGDVHNRFIAKALPGFPKTVERKAS